MASYCRNHRPFSVSQASGFTPMSSIIPSSLWDLDATVAASYGGSGQLWNNLTTSPADGTAQSAYNFYVGDSATHNTTSPTFNGTAGSSAANFSVNGSQYFQIANGNTPALTKICLSTGGQPATVVLAFKTPASLGSANFSWFGNSALASGQGVDFIFSSDGRSFVYNVDNGVVVGVQLATSGSVAVSTNYLYVQTYDHTGGTAEYALNDRALTAGTSPVQTNTTSANGPTQIGYNSNTSGHVPLPNGTLVYGCYGFNAVLTNAQLSAAVTLLNARHGRTYA